MPRVREFTDDLRSSNDPLYARMRTLLAARGVDPASSWLAEMFEDDPNYEFGILVTGDRRVIEFGFHYPNGNVADGDFRDWVDRTHGWQLTPFREEIDEAFSHLEESP
jgi:hypothetical protein